VSTQVNTRPACMLVLHVKPSGRTRTLRSTWSSTCKYLGYF